MGPAGPSSWGTHAEFAQLYETFLDAVYRSPSSPLTGTGRWKLIRSIAAELRSRRVRTVLDCAAGTGFPALDLALAPSLPHLEIHCTDGDLEMLGVLNARAKAKRFEVGRLAPPRRCGLGDDALQSLRLDWDELDQIHGTYDYVLCRGNSLAYADTWTGGRDVTSTGTIRRYLKMMAAKVGPGGYLHVDAPWRLALPREDYQPVATGAVRIWEQVTTESDHRHWRVDFKLPNMSRLKFERFSTLLTIHDVKVILDSLGFEDTEPMQLPAERPGFGVIIARKPARST